jgi:hypothetical protein
VGHPGVEDEWSYDIPFGDLTGLSMYRTTLLSEDAELVLTVASEFTPEPLRSLIWGVCILLRVWYRMIWVFNPSTQL